MKNVNIFALISIGFLNFAVAQNQILNQGSGEYIPNANPTECLSDSERQTIFAELAANRIVLENNNILKRNTRSQVHPLFIWPVAKNPAAPLNSVWSISNHVDHNPNFPNQIQDYSCGARSYDTNNGYNHKGIDIFTWPFSWYQFQNNMAHVVAAADGVIIGKYDGNFDMNCAFNSNFWNAIYVQHADGSVAWYGHLKNGSLTSKIIGNSVIAGEFLGVVGSSGNSNGPHLHFEIYSSSQQLVDPYSGACNSWASSTDSWWAVQKTYQDPKINSVSTHSQVYSFNSCPQTESVYYNNNFASDASVVVSIFLADQLTNTSCFMEIIRPDNSVATSFTTDFTNFYYASYWYWTFNSSLFNQNGTWKIKCTYQNKTVEHLFNYGTLSSTYFKSENFDFYPNPSNDFITISNPNGSILKQVSIVDVSGKTLLIQKNSFNTILVSGLSKGIYFIQFESQNGITKKKFVKN